MRLSRHMLAVAFVVALAGCRDGDATIKSRVEERLAADPYGSGLTVSVDERVVRLQGVVSSDAERRRLEDAVRHVRGVREVQSELAVAGPVTTTSATSDVHRALAATIEAQLVAAGYDALRVAVTDDTVRIAGSVPSDEHDRAMEIARKTAPGFRIEDETIVR